MSENFATNKMKILSSRSTGTAIALVLMLSMVVSLAASVQTVKAADVPSYTFLVCAPNPVGVSQRADLYVWLDRYPPAGTSIGLKGSQSAIFWNWTVTITDPSGSVVDTETVVSDPIGSGHTYFAPTIVGEYTIKATFNQAIWAGLTYLPSSSTYKLTVQQEPIAEWPAAPLPTGYWARPIESENREWASIAGNWLGMWGLGSPGRITTYNRYGKFNPYTTAPTTPHILWTKPLLTGGLVGGEFGSHDYYTGNSYDIKGSETIIINGILYYNIPAGSYDAGGSFAAVDIRTGETLWTHNGTITFGQLMLFETLNQHGVIPYLWGSYGAGDRRNTGIAPGTYELRSTNTGDLCFRIVNATFGRPVTDANGNVLDYIIDNTAKTLTMWNATKCILNQIQTSNNEYWRPVHGADYNWSVGIEWVASIPATLPSLSITKMSDDVILTYYQHPTEGGNASYAVDYVVEAGFSTTDGSFLWSRNDTGTEMIGNQQASFSYTIGDGVYAHCQQETMRWFGYNLNTGKKIWVTEPYTNAWGMYASTIGDGPAYIAYGKMYAMAYDGTLHCYDITNGNNLWNTYIGSSGFETPYGTWPFFGSMIIADGKVYCGTGEHSINSPIYRGEKLYCFDAETGDILWSILGYIQNTAIADGYLIGFNAYDLQWYSFGKGQTAVTVSASPKVSTEGSSVMIEGTVTDQSPGAKDTPAISDGSMEAWMEYLYMQKPMPTNATGVPVKLETVDPNGNFYEISTVTSDMNGMYSLMWKPPVPGQYTIIATFAGSESYYSSYAETSMGVSEAPIPTPPPAAAPDTTMTIIGTGIGTGIAIIIAIAVAVLMLRKRR
jgi:hypothetical protein